MREEREEGEEEEILVMWKAVARNKCRIKKMLAAEITIHIEKRGEGGGEWKYYLRNSSTKREEMLATGIGVTSKKMRGK